MICKLWVAIIAVLFSTTSSYGMDDANLLSSRIHKILSEKIPYAEIRLPNLQKLVNSPDISAISDLSSVRLLEDRASGVALLELISTDGSTVKIQTPYQALVNVPVAVRRIYPNTKLKREDFKMDTLNVATGTAREFRGAIVLDLDKLARMETRQSIMEGQFVVTNAVQKQPDLRKGETVKLELTSGDLTLTTAAVVQENGSVGDRVHVLTNKSKKDVVGMIREDRSIEVTL